MLCRNVRRVGLVLAGASAFGCGQATTQAKITETATFVLRSVAGDSLPVVMFENETLAVYIVADTLRLRPDGTGEEASYVRYAARDGRFVEEPGQYQSVPFRYSLSGDRVSITFDCLGFRQCMAPPHYAGSLSGNVLRLDIALDLRVPRTFRLAGE